MRQLMPTPENQVLEGAKQMKEGATNQAPKDAVSPDA
jgi:hypothetical protein